ncbi:hypothetical protein BS50DRAFT_220746 [Corynespora cassiicola Philippines]|uniref:Wings apart-like protein C-terminal domain-containing protein n=1 Tax=Corynespora cassiicola Philippines TaxID=1448308 RepID=A0A2T2N3N8_CORCC|nr:hypothetical protein BS50DRAFT_220746 [Corynespora cassiicola Philippines]
MAMSMSSTFTSADRRKRIATYGKPSRPASKYAFDDDATSPERPRKQTSVAAGTGLKKPSSFAATATALGSARANLQKQPATRDIFDVPSDDELAPPPSPAPASASTSTSTSASLPKKKPFPKPKAAIDVFDVPSSGDDAPKHARKSSKPLQPLRKPEASRPPPPVQQKKAQRPDPADEASSEDPIAPARRRGRTPQAVHKPDSGEQKQTQASTRPVAKPKASSRATTPGPPSAAPATAKKIKSLSSLPAKKHAVKPAEKPTSDLDIFDFPPSDDESKVKHARKPKPAQLPRPKLHAKPSTSTTEPPDSSDDSDGSSSSKKRKRQGSVSSVATSNVVPVERRRERSVPQRSRKYQKKDGLLSPRQEVGVQTQSIAAVETVPDDPPINKPKRTRMRTTANPPRPPLSKGSSSPAKLHGMLAVRSAPKPSPVAEATEEPLLEDETMYDIPDVVTPLARPTKAFAPGSVTPRQQSLFNNLLGDSSDSATPGMPSISRLQLTNRKPQSMIAGLARSSSDIPQSAFSRKTRLIDTLKQAAESSEEDDSESDEETEEDITEIPNTSAPGRVTTYGKNSAEAANEMEVDSQGAADSQASQMTTHATTTAKITYAKQRSYLEDANMEESLLLSMDLDDMLGLPPKKQVSISEDEEASQAQGIHELRRQGQLQKFQFEAQNAVDDITGTSGMQASGRRSALLEFCTTLADEKVVEQLFDSALGERFLASLCSLKDVTFDFAAAVAVGFILKTEPEYTVLDQVYQSGIIATLTRLLDSSADIGLIARQRKSNLSRIAQESVAEFRTLVQGSTLWSPKAPEKVSPQLVALKSLELLVLGLRKAGSTETLLSEAAVSKLVEVASGPCERTKAGKASAQDATTAQLVFSVLEAASASVVSKERQQAPWADGVLKRLADLMPAFFQQPASGAAASSPSPIKLTIRLCMNVTNNRPRACEAFAGPAFISPLVGLILGLGAMINLAEFSDTARASVVHGGDELVEGLTRIFLEGSERAAKADSMEESQTGVTVGYLAVLMGNLCLNDAVRAKVCERLPGRHIDMLAEQIREFVRYNERVDRESSQFEGSEEGRETWRNFTRRIMLVFSEACKERVKGLGPLRLIFREGG